jgi:hypothetical protein
MTDPRLSPEDLARLLGADEDEPQQEEESTAFERVVENAVSMALSELEGKDLIEIRSREDLVRELVGVAAGAKNPGKMLKHLVENLVDSDEVEEVFADDETIRSAFEKALKAAG